MSALQTKVFSAQRKQLSQAYTDRSEYHSFPSPLFLTTTPEVNRVALKYRD